MTIKKSDDLVVTYVNNLQKDLIFLIVGIFKGRQ